MSTTPPPPPPPPQGTAPQAKASGNVLSIIAMVCGVIAILIAPIIIGVIGIILGVVARTRHERLSTAGIAVAVAGTVIGLVLAYVVLANR